MRTLIILILLSSCSQKAWIKRGEKKDLYIDISLHIFAMQSSYNDIKTYTPTTLPFVHSGQTGLPLCVGAYFYMQNEIWRAIPEFEDYEISNRGVVKKMLPNGESIVMVKSIKGNSFHITRRHKDYSFLVSRLIFDLFSNEEIHDSYRGKIPKTKEGEKWVKIDGLDYEISNYGDVRIMRSALIKSPNIKYGYSTHSLLDRINGKWVCLNTHRIVALYFIPNPNGHETINHKDNNKLNNHVSNLEWCSAKENIRLAYRDKLVYKKLSREDRDAIVNSSQHPKELSLKYKVGERHIRRLIKRYRNV